MTQEQNTNGRPYVILAAVAFDETGDHALDEASRVADRGGKSELHIVHVATENEPGELAGELLALNVRLSRIPELLQARIETLWVARARRVTAHIRVGIPARAILQTAADIGADLIVVGTHRRKGLEKLVLGSVAERVLHDAHCPVLVALPRDYAALARGSVIEPPCEDCLDMRRNTNNQKYWCERHSQTRMHPHIYEPSDRQRNSVMPSA